jgi:hypothetical protein
MYEESCTRQYLEVHGNLHAQLSIQQRMLACVLCTACIHAVELCSSVNSAAVEVDQPLTSAVLVTMSASCYDVV